MFNENSGLVKLWVQNIKDGKYTKEQIPNLSNLREVVLSVLG
jgi:hypothetical protein